MSLECKLRLKRLLLVLAGAGEACTLVRHSFKMSVNFVKKTDN